MKQVPELLAELDRFLETETRNPAWQAGLYAPIGYILSLKAKRVRPLLALLAYQAVSGNEPSRALRLASSLELFHNFTLIHDDIMDQAPLRRGMPTVHAKWNENMAILSGDTLFAIAMQWLVTDFPEQAAALVEEFSNMAIGVCEGQAEDMALEGRTDIRIPEYIEMIRKKTALLIGSSLRTGAIAAGADAATCDAFHRWGESAGIGFQLRDDYLDAFGDEQKVGKQPGGDIRQNKMTYLVLRAFEKASPEDKSELRRLMTTASGDDAKVKAVMSLFDKLGIRSETESEMNKYFALADQAGSELAHLPGSKLVAGLFETLKTREA